MILFISPRGEKDGEKRKKNAMILFVCLQAYYNASKDDTIQ